MGEWIFRGLLATGLLYYLWEGETYSPHAARLPQIVAGATLLFLMLDAIISWRKNYSRKQTASMRESNAGSLLESPRFYATAFCMIAYVLLFPFFGYIVSSVFFVFALSRLLGERRWYVLTICSIVVPLIFWFASEQYLKVVMPKGMLLQIIF